MRPVHINITEMLVLPGSHLCTGAAVMIDHVSVYWARLMRYFNITGLCFCGLANKFFLHWHHIFSHMFSSEAFILLVLYTEIKSITHSIGILKWYILSAKDRRWAKFQPFQACLLKTTRCPTEFLWHPLQNRASCHVHVCPWTLYYSAGLWLSFLWQ